MVTNNFAVYGAKIITELIYDIAYFPIWWYSRGLVQVLFFVRDFLITREKSLALFVWIRNIFTPMYGQSDIAGKLISFFMRLIQIVFRSIIMLFWLLISFLLLAFWLLLPFLVAFEIVYQLT